MTSETASATDPRADSQGEPATNGAGAPDDSSETTSPASSGFGLRGFPGKLGTRARKLASRWSSQIARRNLLLLAAQGNLAETLKEVPENMHLVARQTRLVIEFVDDFRSGDYRDVPWWAVAIAVTALLYAINPADVIPNVLPIVGTMDDLAVVAVAVRVLRSELVRYCEFKGYPREDYFRS